MNGAFRACSPVGQRVGQAKPKCCFRTIQTEKQRISKEIRCFWSCWADSNCRMPVASRPHPRRSNVRFAHRSAVQIMCQYETSSRAVRRESLSGAAGQIRTADLILTKDALYLLSYSSMMATKKGLEPSTSGVTGRRSNQLSYLAIMPQPHLRPWAIIA